jgi:uncharacterized membrane protein
VQFYILGRSVIPAQAGIQTPRPLLNSWLRGSDVRVRRDRSSQMNNESIVAVYGKFSDAANAIRYLDQRGFPHDQVSLVTSATDRHLPRETTIQAGDEAENQAAAGATVGGLLGLLVGAPLLAIPGVGPLLLAGPLAAGMTGALVGGFLGSMTGWGVHSDHVAEYQRMVQKGKVLVVVHGDPIEVARGDVILRDTNPLELHLNAPNSADSEEIIAS